MLQVIKADQDRKYKLTDTLTKTCQDYAHAGLLSPKAKNYRNSKDDPKIARNIVSAMRMLSVADLPPSLETGRCEVLMKVINRALIAKRYHIRAQVHLTSLISPTPVDIATLTRACISNSLARPTAALYQRIAFIRSIALTHKAKTGSKALAPDGAEAKDDSKDQFWLAVDDQLTVYQTLSASDRQVMFDAIYREDVQNYGPPDNTIPLTLMQDVEAWLTTLNMAMEK
ncbi:hypothetical protein B0H19DRAFT_1140662 [Mycena capillaripes]|nr:hypothetical protein B0H19DRAFT_1140662 [Mycena capillaripes]